MGREQQNLKDSVTWPWPRPLVIAKCCLLIHKRKACRTSWNKTEIKLNCRRSGLRFSRPLTVLFYFSFTMCERLKLFQAVSVFCFSFISGMCGRLKWNKILYFCFVSANHRQHCLTAVLISDLRTSLKQNTETVFGIVSVSLTYLFACWKIC